MVKNFLIALGLLFFFSQLSATLSSTFEASSYQKLFPQTFTITPDTWWTGSTYRVTYTIESEGEPLGTIVRFNPFSSGVYYAYYGTDQYLEAKGKLQPACSALVMEDSQGEAFCSLVGYRPLGRHTLETPFEVVSTAGRCLGFIYDHLDHITLTDTDNRLIAVFNVPAYFESPQTYHAEIINPDFFAEHSLDFRAFLISLTFTLDHWNVESIIESLTRL